MQHNTSDTRIMTADFEADLGGLTPTISKADFFFEKK
jgi:hypothetical protein